MRPFFSVKLAPGTESFFKWHASIRDSTWTVLPSCFALLKRLRLWASRFFPSQLGELPSQFRSLITASFLLSGLFIGSRLEEDLCTRPKRQLDANFFSGMRSKRFRLIGAGPPASMPIVPRWNGNFSFCMERTTRRVSSCRQCSPSFRHFHSAAWVENAFRLYTRYGCELSPFFGAASELPQPALSFFLRVVEGYGFSWRAHMDFHHPIGIFVLGTSTMRKTGGRQYSSIFLSNKIPLTIFETKCEFTFLKDYLSQVLFQDSNLLFFLSLWHSGFLVALDTRKTNSPAI